MLWIVRNTLRREQERRSQTHDQRAQRHRDEPLVAPAPSKRDDRQQQGRQHGADYEVGRTLQAKVVTGFASDGELDEAEAIMERLGVVSLPDVPLP